MPYSIQTTSLRNRNPDLDEANSTFDDSDLDPTYNPSDDVTNKRRKPFHKMFPAGTCTQFGDSSSENDEIEN